MLHVFNLPDIDSSIFFFFFLFPPFYFQNKACTFRAVTNPIKDIRLLRAPRRWGKNFEWNLANILFTT